MRYRSHDLTPTNLTSYLTYRRLRGRGQPPQNVQDQLMLSRIVCTREDEYPSIGPNLTAVLNNADIDPEPPTYCLRYCPVPGYHQLLGIANQDGRVAIQDTSVVTPKIPMTGYPCHDNAIFDIAWSPLNVQTMVTVCGDQRARVWDVAGGSGDNVSMTMTREFTGHSRRIKCVEWRPETGTQFATGANDNSIMLWDTRDRSESTADNVIRGAHSMLTSGHSTKRRRETSETEKNVTVTALAWVDTNTLMSVSDRDGIIKQWDLRKNYSLYKGEPLAKLEIHHPGDSRMNGYTSLSLSPCKCYAYVSCRDNKIYKYDIVNGGNTPVAIYTGAYIKEYFTKMAVSPCGRYIASGSGDPWAYLWNVARPGSPVARLGETMAEVTCVAWCQETTHGSGLATLVTASDDMRHQVWRQRLETIETQEIRCQLEMMTKTDDKEPPRVVSRPTPPTPSIKTPRRQTPSIKSFLTPTNVKQPGGFVTPTQSDQKRGVKRRQCNFGNENSPEERSGADSCSRNLSSSISGLLSSPSSKCRFTPETYKSPTKKVTCSPIKKGHLTPRRIASPLKQLFSPLREIKPPQSPTANLPNFNIDGRSPRAVSRVKKVGPKPGSNWLTAYAKEKKLSSENVDTDKLKNALSGLPSNQGFTKLKKRTKKKIVKSK